MNQWCALLLLRLAFVLHAYGQCDGFRFLCVERRCCVRLQAAVRFMTALPLSAGGSGGSIGGVGMCCAWQRRRHIWTSSFRMPYASLNTLRNFLRFKAIPRKTA